tara:strand:+ start:122 stop:445 length:324 start_codon:yes stop_codon:yes gene_type:complete
MKKSLNHFGYCYTSFNYLCDHFLHLYKVDREFKNYYHSFELITNKGYWFKIRIHFDDLKDNKKDFYFSIYGENISCLALFEMHTRLKAITVNEFINNISSPYKVFKP